MKSVICFAALTLCGCSKAPVSSSPTNNAAIQVELLFEKDGMKVYRFDDGGRSIYYTDARGRAEWSVERSNGKTTSREHYSVETAD